MDSGEETKLSSCMFKNGMDDLRIQNLCKLPQKKAGL